MAVEVAMIGLEGMAGLPAFLGTAASPHRCFCQVPGQALRLDTVTLRRFLAGDGALHDLLHRYTHAVLAFLAQNLGCRRATVSESARALQQAGLIRYSRGRITILDRDRLQAAACQCYLTIRHEFDKLR